jgi:hypothetical protein
VSGDSQIAPIGALLPKPLAVRVYDSVGNPYPGIMVGWTLNQAGQLGQSQTLTDSTGTAKTTWQLGNTPGLQVAVASVSALPPVNFVGQAIITLQSIAISPKTVTLLTGGAQQFTAVGTFSDGSIRTTSVTYRATGGTVSGSGLYTAGSTPGLFQVIAVQQGGTLADTATVNVIAPGAVLTQIILSPASAALSSGQTRQFSVTGQMSDGSTVVPPVTYAATGGTITTSGLYTAGSTAGTFRVIAVQQGGTLADTSAITITAPVQPPPPVSGQIPELPAGYTLLTRHTGNPMVPSGWSTNGTQNCSVVSDATAPASPPDVMQIRYPAGFPSGSQPVTTFTGLLGGKTNLFITYWYHYNSAFQGEPSNVNKHLFLFSGGAPLFYTEMKFAGNVPTGFMEVQFEQGASAPTAFTRLVEDYAGGKALQIAKDQWHRVSVELNMGTGRVALWVDGTKVGDQSGLALNSPGEFQIAPTWGGNTGATMTADGFLYFDELQVYSK